MPSILQRVKEWFAPIVTMPKDMAERERIEAEEYAKKNNIIDDDWRCRFSTGHHEMPTWKNRGHCWVSGSSFWKDQRSWDGGDRCSERAPNVYAILISHEGR